MITILWLWYTRKRDGDFMQAEALAHIKGAYVLDDGLFKGNVALESTTIEGLAQFCKTNGFRLVDLYFHSEEGYIIAEICSE